MRALAVLVVALGLASCSREGAGLGTSIASSSGAPRDPVAAHGAQLYKKYCALCHGADREGYKADNAPSLKTPTFLASAGDDFLRAALVRGRPGTAMAGYGKAVGGPLQDDEITALIAFIRTGAPPQRAQMPAPPAGDAVHGASVYAQACASCHGGPGQRGTAVYLANPSFLSSATDGFLAYAIAFGRPGTQMVAWKDKLSEQDIRDVISFVRTWTAAVTQPPPDRAVPDDLPIVINPAGKPPEFPPLKEDRYVPMDDVKKALDAGRRMVIADARPPSDWLRMHIPGALSIPYYDPTMIAKLPTDGTWILTYCACPHHASGLLLDELRKRGFKNTAVIDEGILAWARAGYPAIDVDGKPAALPPALPPPAPPTPPPSR